MNTKPHNTRKILSLALCMVLMLTPVFTFTAQAAMVYLSVTVNPEEGGFFYVRNDTTPRTSFSGSYSNLGSTQIRFTAVANEGFVFDGWYTVGSDFSGDKEPVMIVIVDADSAGGNRRIEARFKPEEPFEPLTLTIAASETKITRVLRVNTLHSIAESMSLEGLLVNGPFDDIYSNLMTQIGWTMIGKAFPVLGALQTILDPTKTIVFDDTAVPGSVGLTVTIRNNSEIPIDLSKASLVMYTGENFYFPPYHAVPRFGGRLSNENRHLYIDDLYAAISNFVGPTKMIPSGGEISFSYFGGYPYNPVLRAIPRKFEKTALNWDTYTGEISASISYEWQNEDGEMEKMNTGLQSSQTITVEKDFSDTDLPDFVGLFVKNYIIRCPVDVHILDKSGNLLATLGGGTGNICDPDSPCDLDRLCDPDVPCGLGGGENVISLDGLFAFTDGDQKHVMIAHNKLSEYQLRLEATEGGTMTVVVFDAWDDDRDEAENIFAFADVDLTAGGMFEFNLTANPGVSPLYEHENGMRGAQIPADIFRKDLSGYGDFPPTGIPDIRGATAAMLVLLLISAGLWGYILRRRLRGGGV
jgi:hypothetical protein